MWNSALHPRDSRGRFRAVTSHDVADSAFPLQTLSTQRLSSLFARHLDEAAPVMAAFDRLAIELDRRDVESAEKRDERATLIDVDRRPGESRRQTLRRLYDGWTYLRYTQAEEDTRGHVLTQEGWARHIDPVSLFSGNTGRAMRYASDELKAWWERNGGRVTFTEYVARKV